MSPDPSYDLLIVGGGLAGASLACALASQGRRIAVIEAVAATDLAQPSFDERTIALTYASRRIFEGIGVWSAMAAESCAIRGIHISDRGHFGMTRLDCADAGTDALGYVTPTRTIGAALTAFMDRSPTIELVCPATVARLDPGSDAVALHLDDGRRLTAPILVLADGGRSPLGASVGLGMSPRRYSQRALVALVGIDRDHRHLAYERFTVHGPLALLPMTDRRMAVAWTLPASDAEALETCPEPEFLAALQQAFGGRCGQFLRCGMRRSYPLSVGAVDNPVSGRCVAIGNAAHIVHPVAGQGFNLGLRDVAELAETLAAKWRAGADPGSPGALSDYAGARSRQARRVTGFTDGLIRIFTGGFPGLAIGRGLGLGAVDLLPPARRFFLRRTMGLHGRLPRLARGLPLTAEAPGGA